VAPTLIEITPTAPSNTASPLGSQTSPLVQSPSPPSSPTSSDSPPKSTIVEDSVVSEPIQVELKVLQKMHENISNIFKRNIFG